LTEDRVNETENPSQDESSRGTQQVATIEDLKIPSAYETLLKQHRDAILRIHTLETENENLMNLLKQTLSENARSAVTQVTNPADLLSRIQALESRDETAPAQTVSQPVPEQTPTAPPVSTDPAPVPNHEIAQLRVQNQTLVGQVSKLDGQLQELKSERSRRRRRRKSSSNHKNGMQGILNRLIGK
jgi:hypothetical protein